MSNNEEEEVFEIYLPNNKITQEFSTKTNVDKTRIIELGLSLYNKGNDIMQYWNNDEWKQKISNLEDRLERETTQLTNENLEISDKVRKQTEDKFNARIQTLDSYIKDLENRNREMMEQMQNIYDTIDSKYEKRTKERIDDINRRSDERISELQKALDTSRESYESLLCRTNNSTFKGQDGESFIDKQLNLMYPKAEITDTSQEPGRGDFIFKEGEFICMVENKNYSKNVQKSEIDKFYRDLERESNNDIQCAVFVSMNTGICNRDDFAFEVRNGKPIIFIHKLRDNVHSLKMAINFFKNILSLKDIDLSDKDVICGFKNVSTNLKRNFNKQKSILDKFHSEAVDGLVKIEGQMNELYKLVNLTY
jgi:predicted RNase H-like nuclease (RuvC/YqgF family)